MPEGQKVAPPLAPGDGVLMEVTEQSLVIIAPRGPGRPRAAEPLTPVTIWISQNHHERMCKLANLHDLSVSALGRKVMERAIDRAIE